MAKRLLLVLLFLVLVVGCKKPLPPQITVKSGQITRIDPQGFDVLLHIDAANPNTYALSVRGISANVVVDNRLDLGKVTIDKPVSIPSGQRIPIDVPISSQWKDLPAIATLAAANRTIPYTVKGTVTVGGESVNIDVPYSFDGTITHDQIVKAAIGSLPKIPGFKLP
jgi:LEA14-like dessication related protein